MSYNFRMAFIFTLPSFHELFDDLESLSQIARVICMTLPGFAQQKSLNLLGIHQLVSDSKSEYGLQNEARNRQAVTTAK